MSKIQLPSSLQPQSPVSPPVADINSFVVYLKRLISVMLDEEGDASSDLDKALQDNSNLEILKKFLADFSAKCLLITKATGISPK